MQGELETGKDIAVWMKDAGLAGVVFILGCIIAGLLKRKEPWIVPGAMHREQILAMEARVIKAEAEREEWKKLTLELLTPLETTLGRTRPNRQG